MDPRLLDKLRKVLTLAKEGIEGEAQAAAAILQKMLLEHNLDIADLEKKGAAPTGATEKAHDLGRAAFTWKLDLAEAVAEHYWCVPLVDRRTKTVAFVGRPDNVESLTMLYAWLIQQVQLVAREERARHAAATGEHVDPLRWQVNFGVGAAERLGKRLVDERARQAAEVTRNDMGDVVALALSRETENSDYLERTYGYRVDGRETQARREYRERREAEARQKAAWRERDPEGYYAAFPDERPEEVARRKLENAAYWEEAAKREARRERRRRSYVPRGRGRAYDPEAERREEQADRARSAGREAAGRINLRPFLAGEAPVEKKRIGRKS
jgi:hypothetical protein